MPCSHGSQGAENTVTAFPLRCSAASPRGETGGLVNDDAASQLGTGSMRCAVSVAIVMGFRVEGGTCVQRNELVGPVAIVGTDFLGGLVMIGQG